MAKIEEEEFRCPKCKRKRKTLRETVRPDGTIEHECQMDSCGYFIIWSPRKEGKNES